VSRLVIDSSVVIEAMKWPAAELNPARADSELFHCIHCTHPLGFVLPTGAGRPFDPA
jgi:hypothetical protein